MRAPTLLQFNVWRAHWKRFNLLVVSRRVEAPKGLFSREGLKSPPGHDCTKKFFPWCKIQPVGVVTPRWGAQGSFSREGSKSPPEHDCTKKFFHDVKADGARRGLQLYFYSMFEELIGKNSTCWRCRAALRRPRGLINCGRAEKNKKAPQGMVEGEAFKWRARVSLKGTEQQMRQSVSSK